MKKAGDSRSGYSMTLAEFEMRLQHQVKVFFECWKQKHAESPENWPLEMTSAERNGSVLKWEDHFRDWLDSEASEPPEAPR